MRQTVTDWIDIVALVGLTVALGWFVAVPSRYPCGLAVTCLALLGVSFLLAHERKPSPDPKPESEATP